MSLRSRPGLHRGAAPALRTGLAALALLGATTLAACTGTPGAAGTGAASPAPAATSSSAGTAAYDPADVAFAQMMVPHHQQAVQMSDMLLAKQGVSTDVAALAGRIKAEQQPEITTMQGWLSSWGQSAAGGMDMGSGGGMSASEMNALDAADGSAAERLYLQGMVKHHQGAVAMARDEIANGTYPDAVTLAERIVTSQQAEITTMNDLLAAS